MLVNYHTIIVKIDTKIFFHVSIISDLVVILTIKVVGCSSVFISDLVGARSKKEVFKILCKGTYDIPVSFTKSV